MEKNNEIKRGQWRTGYFIRSVKNAHWPQHQVDLINKDENRIVFENFTEEDKGISRKRICICENKEDASLICEAVNNYDKLKSDNEVLLSALKSVQNIVSFLINTTPTGDNRNRLTHANILSLEAIKEVESK